VTTLFTDPAPLERDPPGVSLETSSHRSEVPQSPALTLNARRAKALFLAADAARDSISFDDSEAARKVGLKLTMCRQVCWCCANSETQEPQLVPVTCKSRLCEHCSKERSDRLKPQIIAGCRRMDSPRFLTLTLATTQRTLTEELDRLGECFRRLRRTKLWTAHVTGGLYTIEVTWGKNSNGWHPHIHAIIDGTYIEVAKLSAEWKRITGDSFIVDLRKCHSDRQLANYLAKYVSGTGKPLKIPPERIAQYAVAIANLRMVQTFGHLHGVKLKTDPEPGTGRLEVLTGLTALRFAAGRGDSVALDLFRGWSAIGSGVKLDDPQRLVAQTRDWMSRTRATYS